MIVDFWCKIFANDERGILWMTEKQKSKGEADTTRFVQNDFFNGIHHIEISAGNTL